MNSTARGFTIGRLARERMQVRAIRFEQIGILAPPARSDGNQRLQRSGRRATPLRPPLPRPRLLTRRSSRTAEPG